MIIHSVKETRQQKEQLGWKLEAMGGGWTKFGNIEGGGGDLYKIGGGGVLGFLCQLRFIVS